jgi:hypothetical protein
LVVAGTQKPYYCMSAPYSTTRTITPTAHPVGSLKRLRKLTPRTAMAGNKTTKQSPRGFRGTKKEKKKTEKKKKSEKKRRF